uniref:Guanine nucleotide-binding protein subunit gamma n=1 Tax=Sinocyclocheilus anshuiensis TaxID=1608454 RepID=A0A671RXY0_9TELE
MSCYFVVYNMKESYYNMYMKNVSKAAAELMAYCESHAKEDPLVTPVPSSENPFREKKIFCTIL